ncbi:DnaQ-like exonuclease [Stenotrophomonas phage StenR_269]|nr:DnaQ-like exonuclease [Stenotrophomonas phage StenR_269]
MSKILVLDIETSPNLAYIWGLRNQFIGINQLVESSEMLCWAAKWKGEDATMTSSQFHNGKTEMVKAIHSLLEEADTVVTFNGERFDLPILNQEFLFAGLKPPKPYMSVDLYRTVSRRFRTPSNKLDYWLKRLGIEGKADTGGFELWVGCLNNDPVAWKHMVEYNVTDVVRTEQLLDRLLPWIPHMPMETPTVNVETGEVQVTCSCGSTHIQRRGHKRTASGLYYRQYQCQKCGKWFRERTNDKEIVKSPLVHAGQI